MLFVFEPYLRGWYPAQIERSADNILGFTSHEPSVLFHDFVDHGPDATFSLENEVEAAGSASWTNSGVVDLDLNAITTFNAHLAFDTGYRQARRRWPKKVRPSRYFAQRIEELREHATMERLYGRKVNADINLISDEAGNVDFRCFVGTINTRCAIG